MRKKLTTRKFSPGGFETVTATDVCRHCERPIYSAGGERHKGALGWLHFETGDRDCAPSPAKHAKPKNRPGLIPHDPRDDETSEGVELSIAEYQKLISSISKSETIAKDAADKIDQLLHLQEHDQMSTEEMLDELVTLRDRIRTHVKAQKRTKK